MFYPPELSNVIGRGRRRGRELTTLFLLTVLVGCAGVAKEARLIELGTAATDGGLSIRVLRTDRLQGSPSGLVTVELDVENVSDEDIAFEADSQYMLIDKDKRQPESMFVNTESGNLVEDFLESQMGALSSYDASPGERLSVQLIFDVAGGEQPEGFEFHGEDSSRGLRVRFDAGSAPATP
jgi:hypothetical protein